MLHLLSGTVSVFLIGRPSIFYFFLISPYSSWYGFRPKKKLVFSNQSQGTLWSTSSKRALLTVFVCCTCAFTLLILVFHCRHPSPARALATPHKIKKTTCSSPFLGLLHRRRAPPVTMSNSGGCCLCCCAVPSSSLSSSQLSSRGSRRARPSPVALSSNSNSQHSTDRRTIPRAPPFSWT